MRKRRRCSSVGFITAPPARVLGPILRPRYGDHTPLFTNGVEGKRSRKSACGVVPVRQGSGLGLSYRGHATTAVGTILRHDPSPRYYCRREHPPTRKEHGCCEDSPPSTTGRTMLRRRRGGTPSFWASTRPSNPGDIPISARATTGRGWF